MKIPRPSLSSFLAVFCFRRRPHSPEVRPLSEVAIPGEHSSTVHLSHNEEKLNGPVLCDNNAPEIKRDGGKILYHEGNSERQEDPSILLHEALSLSDDDQDKPYRLKHCGDLFLRRFRTERTKEVIDQALFAYELAIISLLQDSDIFLECLFRAADALLDRYELVGTLADINDAITKLEAGVNRTTGEDSTKAARLNSLGTALARRFQRTANLRDIDSAIVNQEQALVLTPESHEDLPAWLSNLGTSFKIRFGISGAKSDITRAISYQNRALEIVQRVDPNHPDIPAWLSNLGSSFSHRFEHSGDLSDISYAILNGQKSVRLTPDADHRLPGRLNNLAISHVRRFNHSGDIVDLSNAISCQQRAVSLTPDNNIRKSDLLNNLGTMYQRRFQSTKNPIDISDAVSAQQRATELVPKDHSHLPVMLHNLDISYQVLFRYEGNLEDISNAVSSQEQAVQLTPAGHTDLPSRLNSLGNAYSRRFERTGEIDDLVNCISCHERAVEFTPEGHVEKSARLGNLGKSYLRRHKEKKDPSDLTLAISQYRNAAINIYGIPSTRLSSAEIWARFCRLINPQQAFEAYGIAIDLMSRVAGLDQTIQRRHTNLIRISSLTTEAAATAFSMGNYQTALEWLEQGRCLVWSQLNQLRTPLDDLSAYNEKLAARLLEISKALETLGSREEQRFTEGTGDSLDGNITLEEQTREHIRKAQEWDDIIAEIRGIPQFKDFLRPRRANDLLENLPKVGFLVVINVHERRSDAVILHSGNDPVHIHLRNLMYKHAEELRDQLRTSERRVSSTSQKMTRQQTPFA